MINLIIELEDETPHGPKTLSATYDLADFPQDDSMGGYLADIVRSLMKDMEVIKRHNNITVVK